VAVNLGEEKHHGFHGGERHVEPANFGTSRGDEDNEMNSGRDAESAGGGLSFWFSCFARSRPG